MKYSGKTPSCPPGQLESRWAWAEGMPPGTQLRVTDGLGRRTPVEAFVEQGVEDPWADDNVFLLEPGELVTLLDARRTVSRHADNLYLRVLSGRGRSGWVHGDFLARV